MLEQQKDLLKGILEVQKEYIKNAKASNPSEFRELEKTIEGVDKSYKEFNETVKAQKKIRADVAKLQAGILAGQTDEAKQVAELRVAKQQQNKELKEEAQIKQGLLDAYQLEARRLNKLRKELKAMIIEEGKSSKATRQLAKEVQRLDRELKDVDATAGQFHRSVGNYPKTASAAEKAMLGLGIAVNTLSGQIGSLNDGLLDNEDLGEDAVGISERIGASWDVLTNRAARLGSGIAGLFRGEGLAALHKIRTATDDVTGAVIKAGDAAEEAGRKNFALALGQIEARQRVVELTNAINEQNAIAGDNTRSFDEIANAAKESSRLEAERAAILNELIKQEREIVEIRLQGTEDDQLKKALKLELAEITRTQTELEGELALAEQENAKIIREVQQDLFERRLDFAIDAFDVQKTINERIIGDDRKTLAEREDLFLRTTRLADEAFRDQIKLAEDFTGRRLDLNELVKLDDQQQIRERLKLEGIASDIVLGRLLEIIKERKLALQDLADLRADLEQEARDNALETAEFIARIESETIRSREIDIERELRRNDLTLAARKALEEELLELRKRQLENAAEFEIQMNAKTAEEVEAIRKELANDIKELENEAQEESERRDAERMNALITQAQQVADSIAQILQRAGQAEIDAIERRIDANQRALETAQALGTEELAFRQQQAARLELEREREAKKQEKRARLLASLNLFAEFAKENPNTAAIKSIAQQAIFNSLIGFFNEGTERVSAQNNIKWRSTGTDDYLAAVHEGEKIFKTADAEKIGYTMSNSEAADIIYQIRHKQYVPEYLKGMLQDTTQGAHLALPVVNTTAAFDDQRIVNGLEKLNRSLDNFEIGVQWTSLNEAIETRIRNSAKEIVRHVTSNRGKLWK